MNAHANNAEPTSLETDIVILYSQYYALTHELLTKIRLFDESNEWAKQNFQSCAHWLHFRVGLSLHAAQEKVRTARALKVLPQIDEKMKVGELSYSKAQALSRIANTENESELLQIAEHATAAQVERLVRSWVRVDEADAKKQEAKKEDRRGCHIFFDESGMCVVSAKLRAEEGALLMKAIEVAREKGQSLADALVTVAERSLVASETKDGARYQVIVHTGPGFDEGTVEGRLGDKVALPAGSIKRVMCDAATIEVGHDKTGAVIDVGRKTRRISTKLRLAINQRDGGCNYPGCTSTIVEAHHIRAWSDGGETNLANLRSLCAFHHHAIHDGKALLGANGIFLHPDGRPIESALPRSTFAPLRTTRARLPVPSGERLDYGYALSVLRP
jgi:hypothetical protein